MEKRPVEIIHQCTSATPKVTSASSGDSNSGEAASTRVLVKFSDGSVETIFTGPEFSEAEYEQRIAGRHI